VGISDTFHNMNDGWHANTRSHYAAAPSLGRGEKLFAGFLVVAMALPPIAALSFWLLD
jgi:hypothetical protein